METRAARLSLGFWTLLVVLFLWIPLVLICVYAFNSSNIQSWPIAGFSTKWFHAAWHNEEARSALPTSTPAMATPPLNEVTRRGHSAPGVRRPMTITRLARNGTSNTAVTAPR